MDQKNLILAIVLSVVILVGFQFYMELYGPKPPETPVTTAGEQGGTPGEAPPTIIPEDGSPAPATAVGEGRPEALAEAERVTIGSGRLEGSLALTGGRIDDLVLKQYRETLDPESDKIVLLSPPGVERPYYTTFGWTSADDTLSLPDGQTVWRSDSQTLGPGDPVLLYWENGEGLRFEREVALDDGYLFTVTQRVINESDRPVTLAPYGLVSRTGTPDVLGFYILHEGLIGVFDGTLVEVDYDDLQDKGTVKQESTSGWLGITDKYWLVALLPDQERTVNSRFVHSAKTGKDKYQADLLYEALTVPAGGSKEISSRVFAGAKEVLLLDGYEDQYGIDSFWKAVDFGWFFFLTYPLFYAMHWLYEIFGNYGVAILVLTVGIKLVFFPLANKSYVSMAKMRKLQPKMLELRERYGDDKQKLNQAMMELYKKEGANPLSGCLPILIQIPVFFALYKVLFVSIEMRQAPFFGWVQDLSAPDPTSWINGFSLLPWEVPDLGAFAVVSIGIWPILMGLTMFFQMRLNPQPPDPIQAKIFAFMPLIFTFLLAQFPAGLVIYWTWNNLLSMLQQIVIMKRAGVPIGRQATPSKS
jgi:YidC/Oxa1 family membrane protein insertase